MATKMSKREKKSTQQNTTSSRENSLTNISQKNGNTAKKKIERSKNKTRRQKQRSWRQDSYNNNNKSTHIYCAHRAIVHFLVKSSRFFVRFSPLTRPINIVPHDFPLMLWSKSFSNLHFYKYLWASLKLVCYD